MNSSIFCVIHLVNVSVKLRDSDSDYYTFSAHHPDEMVVIEWILVYMKIHRFVMSPNFYEMCH